MKKNLILFAMSCLMTLSCTDCPKDAKVVMVHPHEEELETAAGDCKTVFLAGTIDMGNSVDWQAQIEEYFSELAARQQKSYMLFNPRQVNWDPTRENEMDYQVNWELAHLEKADYIIMNILPTSKSPISLLEMGLHARSKKIFVVCQPEYYRYDNVRITCEYYNIPLYDSLEAMLAGVFGK